MTKPRMSIKRIVGPLLVSSLLGVLLYVCRVLAVRSFNYWYLVWNLVLAWVPLLLSYALIKWLRMGRWLSVKGLALTALWLGFLPNSFYVVSDLIHLSPTHEIGLLFDAVMIMVFAWNGLLLGFISLYLVHLQLRKRLQPRLTVMLVGFILVLSSFAVYLGRSLTWNTWDIIVNPGGILLDVSDRIIKPTAYPSTFTTTVLFSVTLIALYYTVYKLVAVIRDVSRS
ncbi:MAG: hypothetical protein JWO47_1032 [Candidatus Saccharibacteria bacterium]|nr:hypothetical protein [Candidatus Saccharibacteria bacterium]